MNILILGGNRFFGKKLAHKLLDDGHELTLLNRGNIKDELGDKVSRIKCDRTNPVDLQKSVGNTKWDIVYDQICYTAKEARGAVKVFKDNIGHYIFTSSQSVYGPNPNLTEDFFEPHNYTYQEVATKEKNYAEAKRQSEAAFFGEKDFPVTAVRFPIVLGADDYTERLLFHIKNIAQENEIFFPTPDAKISFISSDDAAEVLYFLGNKSPKGPINAASADPISLEEFSKEIERLVGKKILLAENPTDENQSPYGIESDWFMDIGKLKSLGLTPCPIKSWLGDEVQAVIQSNKF